MFTVVWRALRIIRLLYPIASQVYDIIAGKKQKHVSIRQSKGAIESIIIAAKRKGINIGHTEAELVRSAIHYVKTKGERYTNLKK